MSTFTPGLHVYFSYPSEKIAASRTEDKAWIIVVWKKLY